MGWYLRQHLEHSEGKPVAKWLAVLHALVAAVWIVPALLIAYLTTQHRLPAGPPILVAVAIAFALAAAIAITLVSRLGLRMLRFITLIPVVLSVAAVLRLGSPSLDQTLSVELGRKIGKPHLSRRDTVLDHMPPGSGHALQRAQLQHVVRNHHHRVDSPQRQPVEAFVEPQGAESTATRPAVERR